MLKLLSVFLATIALVTIGCKTSHSRVNSRLANPATSAVSGTTWYAHCETIQHGRWDGVDRTNYADALKDKHEHDRVEHGGQDTAIVLEY